MSLYPALPSQVYKTKKPKEPEPSHEATGTYCICLFISLVVDVYEYRDEDSEFG
jgi:hypothetical protein